MAVTGYWPPRRPPASAQAGQTPGPVFNTTIQARDAEDALAQWKRYQNQVTAARLNPY